MSERSPAPSKKVQVSPAPTTGHADSLWLSYIVSVLAAWMAEFATYPLDLFKTRLQVQGEIANKAEAKLAAGPYKGTLGTAIGIARDEGLTKLWQGMPAVLLRQAIYAGSRLVIFQKMRNDLFEQQPGEHFPMWKSAVCGIGAGVASQYIASPADLLKVHMQMEGKRKLMGLPPRVHGLGDAFVKVYQAGGVKGLWKGSVPNMWRSAFINLGDLTAYDYSKRLLLMNTPLEDGLAVYTISSFTAGLVACVLGCPADTIKTRIMNQPTDAEGRPLLYKSMYDCASQSIRNEGPLSLYKGFVPLFWRLAPFSMAFWISYEVIMRLIGGRAF